MLKDFKVRGKENAGFQEFLFFQQYFQSLRFVERGLFGEEFCLALSLLFNAFDYQMYSFQNFKWIHIILWLACVGLKIHSKPPVV